jgi:hypothetical protein
MIDMLTQCAAFADKSARLLHSLRHTQLPDRLQPPADKHQQELQLDDDLSLDLLVLRQTGRQKNVDPKLHMHTRTPEETHGRVCDGGDDDTVLDTDYCHGNSDLNEWLAAQHVEQPKFCTSSAGPGSASAASLDDLSSPARQAPDSAGPAWLQALTSASPPECLLAAAADSLDSNCAQQDPLSEQDDCSSV